MIWWVSANNTNRRYSPYLVSYLLFEEGYTRERMDLGYRDTLARKDEVARFLNVTTR